MRARLPGTPPGPAPPRPPSRARLAAAGVAPGRAAGLAAQVPADVRRGARHRLRVRNSSMVRAWSPGLARPRRELTLLVVGLVLLAVNLRASITSLRLLLPGLSG